MHYKELIFTILSAEDFHRDLIIHQLAQIGFEAFEELDLGFKAYIPSKDFNETLLTEAIGSFDGQVTFSYEVNLIPHKNWNEVWESNFRPITIGNECYVRASFHEPDPAKKYEIVIDPKMAFGTGHHQTTALMLEFLLTNKPAGKIVLDMGCGSGILAILALKVGAARVVAIDNDPVCYRSTLDNLALNGFSDNIEACCGSVEAIPDDKFDLILANINRNILLSQMDAYRLAINRRGELLVSGFYDGEDLEMIKHKAQGCGFNYTKHKTIDHWVAAKFFAV